MRQQKSYDRYQHNSKENTKPTIKSAEGYQKEKEELRLQVIFRTKNTRPRKFLARLADSNEDDEPMLVRAYLAQLLNTQGEVVEFGLGRCPML